MAAAPSTTAMVAAILAVIDWNLAHSLTWDDNIEAKAAKLDVGLTMKRIVWRIKHVNKGHTWEGKKTSATAAALNLDVHNAGSQNLTLTSAQRAAIQKARKRLDDANGFTEVLDVKPTVPGGIRTTLNANKRKANDEDDEEQAGEGERPAKSSKVPKAATGTRATRVAGAGQQQTGENPKQIHFAAANESQSPGSSSTETEATSTLQLLETFYTGTRPRLTSRNTRETELQAQVKGLKRQLEEARTRITELEGQQNAERASSPASTPPSPRAPTQ
ncbi:hypothetical protein CC80DRAFT_554309 [Byssothecium circinans]|uniref:Uncharacterized protein n=1 Tax=Byssothecium circinans TaxID=147558 RepID=A0A6A5TE21_9PLEO|nr:hypothetical protein CC80DRAFT_554309 [Byssothecium circinans]